MIPINYTGADMGVRVKALSNKKINIDDAHGMLPVLSEKSGPVNVIVDKIDGEYVTVSNNTIAAASNKDYDLAKTIEQYDRLAMEMFGKDPIKVGFGPNGFTFGFNDTITNAINNTQYVYSISTDGRGPDGRIVLTLEPSPIKKGDSVFDILSKNLMNNGYVKADHSFVTNVDSRELGKHKETLSFTITQHGYEKPGKEAVFVPVSFEISMDHETANAVSGMSGRDMGVLEDFLKEYVNDGLKIGPFNNMLKNAGLREININAVDWDGLKAAIGSEMASELQNVVYMPSIQNSLGGYTSTPTTTSTPAQKHESLVPYVAKGSAPKMAVKIKTYKVSKGGPTLYQISNGNTPDNGKGTVWGNASEYIGSLGVDKPTKLVLTDAVKDRIVHYMGKESLPSSMNVDVQYLGQQKDASGNLRYVFEIDVNSGKERHSERLSVNPETAKYMVSDVPAIRNRAHRTSGTSN